MEPGRDPGPPPFTAAWAAALAVELTASEGFRRAAGGWQGRLVLERAADETLGEPPRAVLVELAEDTGPAARAATAADREGATFVVRGTAEVWQRILAGSGSPLTELLRGRLELVKGSIVALTPLAAAASELARAAARLGGRPAPVARAAPAATAPAGHLPFRSTGPGGLDRDALPIQLFQKAKRDGIWDPMAIDMGRDREDWLGLAEPERDVLLRLAALFAAGEESVTRELLPLIRVIAREGRLEEELFLAAFLWEEAKHVEAFRRFFDEVACESSDLNRFHTPSYRRIFYDELPAAMSRLDEDGSPVAQARASATYNMIVEGVLAETGYHVYYSILEGHRILPGTLRMIGLLQQDESRHLAYGVHLLSRLVAEHGEPVWEAIAERMDELLGPAIAIIEEVFALYETPPFGLEPAAFVEFARDQFGRRLARVEKARRPSAG